VLLALAVGGGLLALYERRLWRLRRSRTAQEQLSRRLIQSQEEERQRIAAELHDGLGQSLALIRSRALLAEASGGDAAVRRQFEEISSQSRQALEEVREIAYGLRPHLLDRLGLTKAIHSMLDKVAASSAVHFTAEIDDLDGLLAAEEQIHLYRILQESVNNLVTHAGATEARVSITRTGGSLELSVEDDGRGFVPADAPDGHASGGGFGLAGMRERARILRGEFTIRSWPGSGTRVRLNIGSVPRGGGDGAR
jgi:signal transduction histidine kinase